MFEEVKTICWKCDLCSKEIWVSSLWRDHLNKPLGWTGSKNEDLLTMFEDNEDICDECSVEKKEEVMSHKYEVGEEVDLRVNNWESRDKGVSVVGEIIACNFSPDGELVYDIRDKEGRITQNVPEVFKPTDKEAILDESVLNEKEEKSE